MADVFLSYQNSRKEEAAQVVAAIQEANLTVWWDRELLDEDFSDEIEIQLKSASAIVVIWSPESIKSDYVKSEAHYAWRKKKLINTHTDDVNPEEDIPFLYRRHNSIPVLETRKILAALKRRLAGLPLPDLVAGASDTRPRGEEQRGSPIDLTPQAGRTYRDLDYTPSMVIIPAGSLIMGSAEGEHGSRKNEKPAHPVRLRKPFAVGQY